MDENRKERELEGIMTGIRQNVNSAYDRGYRAGKGDYEVEYRRGFDDAINAHNLLTEKETEKRCKEEYQRGYEDGKHEGEKWIDDDVAIQHLRESGWLKNNNVQMLQYQRGLDDAWEAAEKICNHYDGCFTNSAREAIFGTHEVSVIMRGNTASEALEKIAAWKQKKAEDEEVKVGDEILHAGFPQNKAIITRIISGCWSCMNEHGDVFELNDEVKQKRWSKTGRNFPEIVEVFEKMQECSDNG